MSITRDIVATYRRPGQVMRRLLQQGQREDRALVILMAGCVMVFVSQLPALARRAHLEELELNPLLGGALLSWVFIAPLLLYVLAGVTHLVARAVGGRGHWFGARLALFWALLASVPVLLLYGLIAGFIGPGVALSAIGLLWFLLFAWFWLRGLVVAEWGEPQ